MKTLLRFSLVFAAAVAVLAVGWGWLEYVTLSNDVPDDHITAVVGKFIVTQPWAALGIALGVTNPLSFAFGVILGHIGEDAKRWVKGARVPLVLLAALLSYGCQALQRIADDPNKLCPANHVLTTEGCVERPVITQPTVTPEPSPTVPPSPPPVNPGPPPTPEPVVTPEAPPTPTPVPVMTPTPKPTPKPEDPCVKGAKEIVQYQLRQGHLTLLAGSDPPLAYNDNAEGTKRDCILMSTGDRVECSPPHRVITPGRVWWGVECAPAPVVTPTPLPPAAPTPTPGAYSCGGIPAARVGIAFRTQAKTLSKEDRKAGKVQTPGSACRAPGGRYFEADPGADCIVFADASVRGPKGSGATVDNPSREAHLGEQPGCWWVVRPRWSQEHADDKGVDIGVRHAKPEDPATSVSHLELGDYPPHGAADVGSFARFQFDFAGTVKLKACWPPNVPDPVCGEAEVTHK